MLFVRRNQPGENRDRWWYPFHFPYIIDQFCNHTVHIFFLCQFQAKVFQWHSLRTNFNLIMSALTEISSVFPFSGMTNTIKTLAQLRVDLCSTYVLPMKINICPKKTVPMICAWKHQQASKIGPAKKEKSRVKSSQIWWLKDDRSIDRMCQPASQPAN